MNQNQEYITALNFTEKTLSGLSVVKVGADWCKPCQDYDKNVNSIIRETSDLVSFFAIDIENKANQNSKVSSDMKKTLKMAWAIPHIAILQDWELIQTFVWYSITAKKEILSLLESKTL